MKRADTKIHQIELLLTLDYLLHHTDEEHPAMQVDICEYANKYGLKFIKSNTSGNEVRRQRIGQCLDYLKKVLDKFPDDAPFILEKTESNKYYIEQRHGLSEEQVAKVLAAIKNDKYTKSDDTDFLIERVLAAFSTSNYNKQAILDEYKKLLRNVKKYNSSTYRKIRIIDKAYREGKCVLITQSHFGKLNPEESVSFFQSINSNEKLLYGTIYEKIRCRVYRVEEHNNKPYAILIPLNKEGIIIDAIESLKIPVNLSDKELLLEDETAKDRLDQLFKSNNPVLSKFYGSLDNYINSQIMPKEGFAYKTSFYFDYKYFDRVKRSFEECFSRDLPVVACNNFEIRKDYIKDKYQDLINLFNRTDEYTIECQPVKNGSAPKYGVVNSIVNQNAFVSWLFENPSIAEVVNVVSPAYINTQLGRHFLGLAQKYRDDLGEKDIQKVLKVNN